MTGKKIIKNENSEKIFHMIAKNMTAIISSMSALFLAIGWFLSFIYFFNIGYLPELGINSSVSFLSAIALLGIFVFLTYALFFILPVPLWFYYYRILLGKKYSEKRIRRDFICTFLLNFSLLLSFLIEIFGNSMGEWQRYLYTSLSVILSVAGVFVFMFFSSNPKNGTVLQKSRRKVLILFTGFQSILPGVILCCFLTLILVSVDKSPHEYDLEDFIQRVTALFISIFFIDLYFFDIWSNRLDTKFTEKIVPLLFTSLFIISVLYILGGSNSMSYAAMRKLRLGALIDSTMIVNYQGCQILEKIDSNILKDSVDYKITKSSNSVCSKDEPFSVQHIDIQVAIGETLLLKYPSDKYILGKNAGCDPKKCTTANEKQFKFPQKYVLSYFLEGEEKRLIKP